MVFQHILGNFYFKKKSEFENIFPNMGRVHSNSRSGVDSTELSAKSQQIWQRVHMEYQGDRKALFYTIATYYFTQTVSYYYLII